MKRIELLAPAGNLEKLKIAILYGANAVYLGGKKFSLRAAASNFSIEDIKEGVEFAHEHQAKVYVVVNIVFHNDDLSGLKDYLMELEKIKVDGIICADPIVIQYAKDFAPKLQIHISTQQSITNSYAVKFSEQLGADRVVLAREVNKENLKEIINNSNIEIEYFIHGAMCVAYSGRCMLSNYYSKRDSNRGGCSQSCRWNYNLWKEDDKVNKDDVFFTMSSKDLALAKLIPELIEMGVASLKIEGRMKSIYYLATIISAYAQIIDSYYENNIVEPEIKNLKNIDKAANRSTALGFYQGLVNEDKQLYGNRDEHPTKEFIGYVLDYDQDKKLIKMEQRNNFKVNDKVELFMPNHQEYSFTITKMYDKDFNPIEVAPHAQQIVYIPFDEMVLPYSMMRKVL